MFWMINKEKRFPIRTLIWRPNWIGVFYFQGDSGAPLVCPDSDGVYRLVGLEFHIPIYDCYYGVSIYTRISPHRKWIEVNKE